MIEKIYELLYKQEVELVMLCYYKIYKVTKWEWLYSEYNPLYHLSRFIAYPRFILYELAKVSSYFKKHTLKQDINALTDEFNSSGWIHPKLEEYKLEYNELMRQEKLKKLLDE